MEIPPNWSSLTGTKRRSAPNETRQRQSRAPKKHKKKKTIGPHIGATFLGVPQIVTEHDVRLSKSPPELNNPDPLFPQINRSVERGFVASMGKLMSDPCCAETIQMNKQEHPLYRHLVFLAEKEQHEKKKRKPV